MHVANLDKKFGLFTCHDKDFDFSFEEWGGLFF
jgi:hypothetical protein